MKMTVATAVDLREGGQFKARMEAKDGSEVKVEFIESDGNVIVKETFDTENTYSPEQQRQGWQNIMDNFGRHVEAKRPAG